MSAVGVDKKQLDAANQDRDIFGADMSFAAKEAYKLLRTNLMFALSDAEAGRGHIVGVTSALRGEGKSTTCINLACVLAEQGKKIVIVEGDLRLPTLLKKLKQRGKTGLASALISKDDLRETIKNYTMEYKVEVVDKKPIVVDLLPAGAIPPNPSELLGSRRMEELLKVLAEKYDYVMLDLPPVTAVSDALVATKLVDGVVLVVRNEYADTNSLNEAIRQLQQVDGKILGFAYTCANSTLGGYRKKYRRRYYYYRNNYYYKK